MLASALVGLALIDRASLLIAPCSSGGSGYSQQENPNDDDCATRQGIVIAGIEWLYGSKPEFWTAIASIAIAAFTFTLWTSNEKMWRITRQATKATRRAANAARKSADVAEAALTVAERPYLVPKEPKLRIWRFGQPGMPAPMWNPAEYVGTVEYGVVNRGRTVAFLKEATVCLIFAESLPTVPDYRAGFEGKNNSENSNAYWSFYDCKEQSLRLDLPLNFHPAAFRASTKVTPFGAVSVPA